MRHSTVGRRTIRLADEKRLQWAESQQCHVLVHPHGSVQLNKSAAAILWLCDGSHTRDDIMRDFCCLARDADLKVDIVEFLDAAAAQGWVVEEQAE